MTVREVGSRKVVPFKPSVVWIAIQLIALANRPQLAK